jgi:hypothetical protein
MTVGILHRIYVTETINHIYILGHGPNREMVARLTL